uniref:Protein shisa-4 n=1 Tax=Strongyloides venezuelensis TaxID=75913 RepID=A0A0K0G2T0_STRVS
MPVNAYSECPLGPNGEKLTCEFDCCPLLDFEDGGFYCCYRGSENSFIHRFSSFLPSDHLDSDRFLPPYENDFQTVSLFSLLAAGLIILTMIFVSLPLLFCFYFLCKSCWLRNGENYNGHVQEEVFVPPVCCGFGFPTGTSLVFCTHPSQVNPTSNIYIESGITSLPSTEARGTIVDDRTLGGDLEDNQIHGYTYI